MYQLGKNIVLIGMPGAGKTTIGRKLSEKLKIDFYDSDKFIEQTTGKSIPEIFLNGEDYFRRLETEAIRKITKKVPFVIATGGGVVKDFKNIELLRNRGIIIFINRPLEKIAEKIDVGNRPLLENNYESLKKLYDERIELYKKFCDYEIVNDKTIKDAVNQIISLVCK